MILLNPSKYRQLTITTTLKKSFNESNKFSKLSELNNFKQSSDPLINDYSKYDVRKGQNNQLFSETNNYEQLNNNFTNDYNAYDRNYDQFKSKSNLAKEDELVPASNYKNNEESTSLGNNYKAFNNTDSMTSNTKFNSSGYVTRGYDYQNKPQGSTPTEDQLYKQENKFSFKSQGEEHYDNQRNLELESPDLTSNSKRDEIIERTNKYFNNLRSYENTSNIPKKDVPNASNAFIDTNQEGFSANANANNEQPAQDRSKYNYKFASSEKRFYRNLVDKDNSGLGEDRKDLNNTSMTKYSFVKNDDIYNKGNDLKSKIDSMRNEINNTLKGEFQRSKELSEDVY